LASIGFINKVRNEVIEANEAISVRLCKKTSL